MGFGGVRVGWGGMGWDAGLVGFGAVCRLHGSIAG